MSYIKNNIVGVVVVLLILVLGVFLYYKNNDNKGYSVVYMSTGEVYVGKLQAYNDFVMTDAYIYQVLTDPNDPNKNTFQLQPINEMLWATEEMHLVRDNVIFYGPLSANSKIVETLSEATSD